MEDSAPIPDSQEVVGMAASLLQPTQPSAAAPAQHPTNEFPMVPPSVAYQYALHHSQMYGLPPSVPPPHPNFGYGNYGPRGPVGNFRVAPVPFGPVHSQGSADHFDGNSHSFPVHTSAHRVEGLSQPEPARNTVENSGHPSGRPSGRPPRRSNTGGRSGNSSRRRKDPSSGPQTTQAAEPVDGNSPVSESHDTEEDIEDPNSSANGRVRWENWQVRHLLEAKRAEFNEMDQSGSRDLIVNATIKWRRIKEKLHAVGVRTTAKRCKAKWDVIIREYRKIKDFENKTGNPPYQSLTVEERREENVPAAFEPEWIDLLDTFMASRPSIVPPSVADSSGVMGGDSAVDDSVEPMSAERRLNGKRKRGVGENTKFLVQGVTSGMKESMEMFTNAMKECEEKSNEMKSGNVDKICDVLRVLASAVGRID